LAGASNVGAVSTLPSATTDVIDRWWDITPSAAVTANVTFTYRGAENTCSNPTDNFGAMHWNGSSWDTPVGSNAGVTSGTGTVSASGLSNFSPWVLGRVGGGGLPIELTAFTAYMMGKKVNLSWITMAEINNDYFVVEKTRDMKVMKEVFRTNGAGNSS